MEQLLQFPLRSWKPGLNSEMYDVYIWEQGTEKPAVPQTSNITQIAYVVQQDKLRGFATDKTYNWQVTSKMDVKTESLSQTFIIAKLPNLIVTEVNIDNEVFSGKMIDISVEIKK